MPVIFRGNAGIRHLPCFRSPDSLRIRAFSRLPPARNSRSPIDVLIRASRCTKIKPFHLPVSLERNCYAAAVRFPLLPGRAAPPGFLVGAVLSALKINEDAGIVYYDHGQAKDCVQIFKDNGWNLVRLRLWVHPSGRDGIVNDLAYDAAIARRAKAAGMKVLIDFHYSDSWTDAGNQRKPAAWAGDTFTIPSKLPEDVFWYTSNVVYTLAHKYHVADYISLGNEVTYGMLWPEGDLRDGGHGGWTNWTRFAALVNFGIAGARRGAKKAGFPMPKTIVHVSLGKYWGVVNGFFSGLAAARDSAGRPVTFDIIGLSYYPDNKTDLSDIKETLAGCAAKFGKPILICETAYSYRHVAAAAGAKYPETPEGQAAYLSDLVAAVRDTPGGLGICYWEPEAVPNPISRTFSGSSWRDSGWQALFDTEAHTAEPAVSRAALRSR